MGYISTENAIPIMTSNNAPSGIASASSEYATTDNTSGTHAYRAMNRNTTTYFATKDTTSGWLAYDFSFPIAIGLYKLTPGPSSTLITGMPKSWTFEGSNNGVDWIVLDTRSNITVWTANVANEYQVLSPKKYKIYRLNITTNNGLARVAIGMFEMFEYLYDYKFLISSEDEYMSRLSTLNDITPVLVSNNTPTPHLVERSSVYSSLFEGWQAFDGSYLLSSRWVTQNGIATGWLSLDFGGDKNVTAYSLTCVNSDNTSDLGQAPKSWSFEGWDKTSNSWILLDSRANETSWTKLETRSYAFVNERIFSKYRINITANNGAVVVSLTEMKLYEKLNSLKIMKTVDEKSFLTHGMDKGSHIELGISLLKKSFVINSSDVLGSGKVFKQKIDTTKIPIKKASIT
jgi:hypothetical protein